MPFAHARSANLHYESTGTGAPIVFVHETAADARSWEAQVRWFSRFHQCLGSVLPMGTTLIGHAYLWALPAAERKRQLAQLKRGAGSGATALENGIRESFDELDSTGTCVVLGGFQRDAFGVAAPVHVGRQRKVMALSCGKAEVRPDLDRARRRSAPVLKQQAVAFEELLADIDGLP